MPQRRADRAPGGVDAGDQQQPHRAGDVPRVQLVAVQLHIDQVRGQVVAGVVDVVADLVQEVVEERAEFGDPLVRAAR
jgi:hypothetical protein